MSEQQSTGTALKAAAAKDLALKDMKPKDQVKHLLDQNKLAIQAAIPKHMNPERLLKVAQTAITSTPALLECYVPTLLGGIIQCAQMGLEPNTVLGHAYLVPFFNTKKNRKDAQVIIGYKGLIDLARRSGNVTSIAAHAVRKNDVFEFEYGLNEKLRHIPAEGDRGDITHFYAVAHMKDGGHAFEVMTKAQIEKVKASNGKGNKVWGEHFEEMGRKTAIRRLSKYLPLSVELATATLQDGNAAPELEVDGALTTDFSVIEEEGGDDDRKLSAGNNDAPVERTQGTSAAVDHGGEQQVVAQSNPASGGDASGVSPESPAPASVVIDKIRSLKTLDALDEYISVFDGSKYSEVDRASIQQAYQGRREVLQEAQPASKRKGVD